MPLELSERICNDLPKVRKIPKELKTELEMRVSYLEFRKRVPLNGVRSEIMFYIMNEERYRILVSDTVPEYFPYTLWVQLRDEERERCIEILDEL
jgi:hypothetical protein